MKKTLGLTIAAVCFLTLQAQATPIEAGDQLLIDVSTYYSTTVPDVLGRSWNNLGTGALGETKSKSDLITIANVATDVDISMTIGTGGAATFNSAGLVSSSLTQYPGTATRDSQYMNSATSTSTITISSLDPSLTYDLTFYGSRGVTTDRIMDVTIGSVTQSYNAGGTAGEGLTTFTGITSDGSGTITISLNASSAGGGIGYLGAIDIIAIPEPATMALLVFGSVTVMIRRRTR